MIDEAVECFADDDCIKMGQVCRERKCVAGPAPAEAAQATKETVEKAVAARSPGCENDRDCRADQECDNKGKCVRRRGQPREEVDERVERAQEDIEREQPEPEVGKNLPRTPPPPPPRAPRGGPGGRGGSGWR